MSALNLSASFPSNPDRAGFRESSSPPRDSLAPRSSLPGSAHGVSRTELVFRVSTAVRERSSRGFPASWATTALCPDLSVLFGLAGRGKLLLSHPCPSLPPLAGHPKLAGRGCRPRFVGQGPLRYSQVPLKPAKSSQPSTPPACSYAQGCADTPYKGPRLSQVHCSSPVGTRGTEGWALPCKCHLCPCAQPCSEWGAQPDFEGLHPIGRGEGKGPSAERTIRNSPIDKHRAEDEPVWCASPRSFPPAQTSLFSFVRVVN